MSNIKKWKDKIVYQIFPRSFKDSNNDGDGDLQGIISKLDYLSNLGINAIWLTPIYETQFADAGYDVLDYHKVWKQFGTLNDFKKLAKECKKRKIEIIMDLVLNHVSDEHPWFIKAKSDPKSEEYSYFIWTDKPGDEESIFGGSAWEYVPEIKKYYYHLFTPQQVDLNWGSEKTIKAMAKVVDFWYDLGVRGFRFDAIQHVSKEYVKGHFTHSFAPKMVSYLQALEANIQNPGKDMFIVGEASGINPKKAIKYTRGKEYIADAFYNFSWWWIGWNKNTGRNGIDESWKVSDFANQDAIEYQNNPKIKSHQIFNFLTNHDTSRAISRYIKDKKYYVQGAKSLALFIFAQKGIPSINYGEEIGMLNGGFHQRSDFRDVDAYNSFKIFVDEQKIYTEAHMLKSHNYNSRDNSRIPMQWDKTEFHGFSDNHQPWIKFGDHIGKHNVESQIKSRDSIFNFYKKIIKLRKGQLRNLLVNGESSMMINDDEVIVIVRVYKNRKIKAICNLSNEPKKYKFNAKDIIISTYKDTESNVLRPYESVLVELSC